MPWTIEYDKRAVKELKKLDAQTQREILDYFDNRVAVAENPRQFGKPLAAGFASLWRYRIRDYRVICKIENERLVVLLLRIGHRSKVYSRP